MKKIAPTKTHKRLISSLLFLLEQKVEVIEHMINQPSENATYIIVQDLVPNEKKKLLGACAELKKAIDQTVEELDIEKRKISQVQYINTIQSHIWEHVCDAFSDKMTGYGDQVAIKAKLVDPYIKRISDIVDRLQL